MPLMCVIAQGVSLRREEGVCTPVEALDSGAQRSHPEPSHHEGAHGLGDHYASLMPDIPLTLQQHHGPLHHQAQQGTQGVEHTSPLKPVAECRQSRSAAPHRCNGWLNPAVLNI